MPEGTPLPTHLPVWRDYLFRGSKDRKLSKWWRQSSACWLSLWGEIGWKEEEKIIVLLLGKYG